MDPTRVRARRIVSGLLSVALVFALLEGAASLAYFAFWARTHFWKPIPERVHTAYDPELGWTSLKGAVAADVFGPGVNVTTNARGFRNTVEFGDAVPAGKTRVIALGDSFTLGYDVGDAESWPAWLARLCPGLEVPNMGQSGYGIDQSYLWYRRDGTALDHQVVVLAFIDDDLTRVQVDNMAGYGKPVLALQDGRLVPTGVPVPRAPYLAPILTQNVALLGQLRLVELPRALLAHFGRAEPERNGEVLSVDEAARVDEAILRALREEASARGSTLVLAHLPHLATDRPSELSSVPEFAAPGIARVAAEGVPFADLREEMGRVPDPERRALFQAHSLSHGPGSHYSSEGNRFVAAAVAKRLESLGLIPAEACRD